jgi:hypothetical protein
MERSRWASLFLQAGPILFLVLLFHDGLRCWFMADDFAWLSLIRQVHSLHDLVRILFEPAAQGTVRPWSERGFFLLFEYLFGLDDLPFRIFAFATMAANLLLVNRIVRRITHSPLAGFVAAISWSANTALMTPMTWSSAYNEVMCSLFLLSALVLFMKFDESGRMTLWWCHLVVFILGFGALEINVVYPALAAAYALFGAPRENRRRLVLSLIPLAAVSAVYFFWHRAVAPLPVTGAYAVHFDGRAFRALLLYGKWSLLPVDWVAFGHSARTGKLILWTEIVAISALLISEARRRRTTVLFFVLWWLFTLTPVLVLPEHRSDYYLTIPLIGLAMLFGFGFTSAVRDYGRWRWLALLPAGAYLWGMIPISLSAAHWTLDKTTRVRGLVLGAQAAHRTHPGKTILINGMTADLYHDSLDQGALIPLGIEVYLTPEAADVIAGGDGADAETQVLDPDVTLHAMENDEVVIYSVAGDHLRNMTEDYERSAPNRLHRSPGGVPTRLPSRLDVGNPLYSWLLGPSWLPPESGVRWMPGSATVRIRGPESRGSKLELDGFFPAEQLKGKPRVLKVSLDGVPVGDVNIHDPDSGFRRLFNVPSSAVGRDSVEIELEASPVDTRGGLQYGMVFGKIAIRP